MKVENVILPTRGNNSRWDLEAIDGVVQTFQPTRQQSRPGTTSSILLPALCHPHIHLDKPYILTCNQCSSSNHPDYSDLVPESGSFSEALSNTSRAKERYTADDLYLRGSQLLATSYKQGVTSLRAFVELDHVTGDLPLTTAITLKQEFAHLIEVQLCAFAQDPIFSTEHGETNRAVIASALADHHSSIDAIGTTPYVEESNEASARNIEWAIVTSLHYGIHLDFHLDYNLRPPSVSSPLTYSVVELLRKHGWLGKADKSKTIVLGHCTQLTTLPSSELASLADGIKSSGLPIHFVGLPTSDLFMMGRPSSDAGRDAMHARPRGTLQVLSLIQDYGLSACLGVNNVGNAFTPYGTGDPLHLASFGVGIYQAGTMRDAKTLYSCVSWRARKAIGLDVPLDDGDIAEGCRWYPMLLVENAECTNLPGKAVGLPIRVPARQRVDFKDVVWDPPDIHLRKVIG
ncbi:amidohydrolase [Xylariales sp. AK1849]|nr:amidohydrolase [Xylariales sp. AK1849]